MLNNYSPQDVDLLRGICNRFVGCYLVFGYEVAPTTGTPHLQGFVYFVNKKAFSSVLKILPKGCHFEEIEKSVTANIRYCKKDGNFEEFGKLPSELRRQSEAPRRSNPRVSREMLMNTSLSRLVDDGVVSVYSVPTLRRARDILAMENEPYTHDDVRGVWYYGEPGVGKSYKARTENPDAYIKAQNKWFDGYAGQKVIILDDLDSACLGHYLKIWADRYSCVGETKGSTVQLVHEKFIVTSNYHPSDLWPEDVLLQQAITRRFEIIRVERFFQ